MAARGKKPIEALRLLLASRALRVRAFASGRRCGDRARSRSIASARLRSLRGLAPSPALFVVRFGAVQSDGSRGGSSSGTGRGGSKSERRSNAPPSPDVRDEHHSTLGLEAIDG